jgi:hypothetical protein
MWLGQVSSEFLGFLGQFLFQQMIISLMYHQMPLRAACLAYPSTLNMAAVSSF